MNYFNRLSILDRLLFIAISLLVLILGLDLVDAIRAQSCSIKVYVGCYPWGAEGPVAGDWFYTTKERYLIQSITRILLLLISLSILSLFKRSTGKSVSALILAISPFLIAWAISFFALN